MYRRLLTVAYLPRVRRHPPGLGITHRRRLGAGQQALQRAVLHVDQLQQRCNRGVSVHYVAGASILHPALAGSSTVVTVVTEVSWDGM